MPATTDIRADKIGVKAKRFVLGCKQISHRYGESCHGDTPHNHLSNVFSALSNNWLSSPPSQGGNSGSSPDGATKSALWSRSSL